MHYIVLQASRRKQRTLFENIHINYITSMYFVKQRTQYHSYESKYTYVLTFFPSYQVLQRIPLQRFDIHRQNILPFSVNMYCFHHCSRPSITCFDIFFNCLHKLYHLHLFFSSPKKKQVKENKHKDGTLLLTIFGLVSFVEEIASKFV